MRYWKTAFVALGAAGIALLASVGSASAQSNDALVKRGLTLWQARGCNICHSIGRKQGAPDLAGVTSRRSKEWLNRWLKDTPGMIASDSVAKAMVVEWKNTRMPGFKLSDPDIDALLAFIDAESAKL